VAAQRRNNWAWTMMKIATGGSSATEVRGMTHGIFLVKILVRFRKENVFLNTGEKRQHHIIGDTALMRHID